MLVYLDLKGVNLSYQCPSFYLIWDFRCYFLDFIRAILVSEKLLFFVWWTSWYWMNKWKFSERAWNEPLDVRSFTYVLWEGLCFSPFVCNRSSLPKRITKHLWGSHSKQEWRKKLVPEFLQFIPTITLPKMYIRRDSVFLVEIYLTLDCYVLIFIPKLIYYFGVGEPSKTMVPENSPYFFSSQNIHMAQNFHGWIFDFSYISKIPIFAEIFSKKCHFWMANFSKSLKVYWKRWVFPLPPPHLSLLSGRIFS